MSRWIDADELGASVIKNTVFDKGDVIKLIEDAPSIDIVRCRECRWSKPYSDKQLECDALGLGGLKFPDDFCSYGRRSEKPNNSTTEDYSDVGKE